MAGPDVIVVGGGIGGLSSAFALARQGLSVRVLEQAAEFAEVGAGLQLAPNCTRILSEYGLLEEVRSLGVLPKAMIGRDAIDGTELTRLDLRDVEKRYGFPYVVIHRSDLLAILLRACEEVGVDLRNESRVDDFQNLSDEATVELADGERQSARLILAADGLSSRARSQFVGDEPVSSAYVAFRGTVPVDQLEGRVREGDVSLEDVVVYLGPACHFVHYPLRGGEMLNQVAVFESPRALAGEDTWGTADEMDDAFAGMHPNILEGLTHMWRDKSWRMFDREPIDNWVFGKIVLLGDAAHPPLQYMAQGAIMAIEDGWVLAQHAAAQLQHSSGVADLDWEPVKRAYNQVRPPHCRRVLTTARAWGELWHVSGNQRQQRNAILRGRDIQDYSFVDWIYGPTALRTEDEAAMFTPIPLSSVHIDDVRGPSRSW